MATARPLVCLLLGAWLTLVVVCDAAYPGYSLNDYPWYPYHKYPVFPFEHYPHYHHNEYPAFHHKDYLEHPFKHYFGYPHSFSSLYPYKDYPVYNHKEWPVEHKKDAHLDWPVEPVKELLSDWPVENVKDVHVPKEHVQSHRDNHPDYNHYPYQTFPVYPHYHYNEYPTHHHKDYPEHPFKHYFGYPHSFSSLYPYKDYPVQHHKEWPVGHKKDNHVDWPVEPIKELLSDWPVEKVKEGHVPKVHVKPLRDRHPDYHHHHPIEFDPYIHGYPFHHHHHDHHHHDHHSHKHPAHKHLARFPVYSTPYVPSYFNVYNIFDGGETKQEATAEATAAATGAASGEPLQSPSSNIEFPLSRGVSVDQTAPAAPVVTVQTAPIAPVVTVQASGPPTFLTVPSAAPAPAIDLNSAVPSAWRPLSSQVAAAPAAPAMVPEPSQLVSSALTEGHTPTTVQNWGNYLAPSTRPLPPPFTARPFPSAAPAMGSAPSPTHPQLVSSPLTEGQLPAAVSTLESLSAPASRPVPPPVTARPSAAPTPSQRGRPSTPRPLPPQFTNLPPATKGARRPAPSPAPTPAPTPAPKPAPTLPSSLPTTQEEEKWAAPTLELNSLEALPAAVSSSAEQPAPIVTPTPVVADASAADSMSALLTTPGVSVGSTKDFVSGASVQPNSPLDLGSVTAKTDSPVSLLGEDLAYSPYGWYPRYEFINVADTFGRPTESSKSPSTVQLPVSSTVSQDPIV